MNFFVYKGTGGLFHNLFGLSQAIDLSIKYNITLIIDINANKVFGGDLNDFFRLRKKFKYKYNYENISLLNDIKLKSLRKCGYNGNNKNYDINLNNKINILYGYSQNFKILKYITVSDDLFNKIKLNNKIIKEKYISVHFRNSDKKNDKIKFIKKIRETFNKYNEIKTLYIASDDYNFYETIEEEFSNCNIIRKTFFEKGLVNLHYGIDDKKKQQYDCLVDIYYILLSDIFIPSMNSEMSKGINYIIKNKCNFFPNIISKAVINF